MNKQQTRPARFIARDTGEPMRVLGGYDIAGDGSIIREPVKREPGKDYGADPIGDGTFRMVPSGDVVDYAERCKRLGS